MRRDINEPIIEKKAAAFFLYIAIIQAIFLKFPYSAGVMTGKTEPLFDCHAQTNR